MLRPLTDTNEEQHLREKLRYLAWRRFGIRATDADDIVQNACVAYLGVRDRYAAEQNQYGILVGIFRNKCREFLERERRQSRRLQNYCRNPDAKATNPHLDPDGNGDPSGVLDELVHREDGEQILRALAELRPDAREMLLLLASVGRGGLLERHELNKNTLDSRLHLYRHELREILRRKGIRI